MKNIAKLSFVASLAIVSLNTLNAKELSEAIKNVDVSGTVMYRYDDWSNDGSAEGSNTTNTYKVVLNLKSKVNDDVSFNTSIAANNNASVGGTAGDLTLDTQNEGDENLDIEATKINFSYTGLQNTTFVLGKQGIITPWTVASNPIFNDNTGTGIYAVSTWGPISLSAAYFNQTNLQDALLADSIASLGLNGSENISTVGISGSFMGVNLDAWYLDLDGNDTNSFDSYTVGGAYKFAINSLKLALSARYTSLELDNVSDGNTLTKFDIKAKLGIFDAMLAYGITGNDGGLVALNKFAKTGMAGWTTSLNGIKDADFLQTALGVQILPSLNLSAHYYDIDADANTSDIKETFGQVSYKMSKNFTTLLRYGEQEKDTTNRDIGRLQILYSY